MADCTRYIDDCHRLAQFNALPGRSESPRDRVVDAPNSSGPGVCCTSAETPARHAKRECPRRSRVRSGAVPVPIGADRLLSREGAEPGAHQPRVATHRRRRTRPGGGVVRISLATPPTASATCSVGVAPRWSRARSQRPSVARPEVPDTAAASFVGGSYSQSSRGCGRHLLGVGLPGRVARRGGLREASGRYRR